MLTLSGASRSMKTQPVTALVSLLIMPWETTFLAYPGKLRKMA